MNRRQVITLLVVLLAVAAIASFVAIGHGVK